MDDTAELTAPVSARDHSEGLDHAPLTLVEYGDYQCPYCGAAFPVVKRVQKALGKKLRFVFRNFPLTQAHPLAMAAAKTAEAAALQDKFWEMHDLLYKQQASFEPTIFAEWAGRLGLDARKFETDFASAPIAKRIKDDRSSGIRSGVNGTPTFFINGKRHDGAPDFESLMEALESELAARPA